MPGVLLERHLSMHTACETPISQPDPDWTHLINEAAENANLDLTDALPPPLEIITINDNDVLQVPLVQLPTHHPVILPKVKQSSDTHAPLPHPWELPRYPTCDRNPLNICRTAFSQRWLRNIPYLLNIHTTQQEAPLSTSQSLMSI